jgi:hypothetical protein
MAARRASRKAACSLIPFLILCWVVNYLTHNNIGFAALTMNRELGFTAEMYGFGAGIFFIWLLYFEVPSNLILERVYHERDRVGADSVRGLIAGVVRRKVGLALCSEKIGDELSTGSSSPMHSRAGRSRPAAWRDHHDCARERTGGGDRASARSRSLGLRARWHTTAVTEFSRVVHNPASTTVS